MNKLYLLNQISKFLQQLLNYNSFKLQRNGCQIINKRSKLLMSNNIVTPTFNDLLHEKQQAENLCTDVSRL